MKRSLFILGLIAVSSLSMLASGCVITARPATVTVEASYGGWNTYYYNGYIVYVDSLGRPYYYYNGRIMYVPSTWVHYNVVVHSWRTNRVAYNRWHARYHTPTYRARYYGGGPRTRTQPAPVRHRYKR